MSMDFGESAEAPLGIASKGRTDGMRLYLLSGACAASMLLALTPVAGAADIDIAPEPAGFGWYVSVFGGLSMADEVDGSFTETNGPINYFDFDFDNGFTAGAALGAHFNEWLRGEVEVSGNWHDAEGFIGTAGFPTDTGVEGDATALFVLANLWVDVPMGEVVRPYIGGGLGFGRLDLDLQTTGGSSLFDDSDWGFAYQLGAGVAFDFTSNMTIDIGYRFKAINNAELEVADYADATEDVEFDYKSHNIIAGLRFSF
jgi:opacity protein-like surface antigen